MSTRDRQRLEALTTDAVLFGLVAEAQRELDELGPDAELLLELELAAAAVTAAAYTASEPLPAALAAKLLEDARASTKRTREALPVVTPAQRRLVSGAGWLLAAAAIIVAVVGWTRHSPAPIVARPNDAPASSAPTGTPSAVARERAELLTLAGTSKTAWKATSDAAGTGATGDIVWHAGVQRGVMRLAGLAPNEPTRSQYQLWIFDAKRDDAQPVDGGVFDVGANGEILVPVTAKLRVGEAKLFAITVEPPGGVVVSKRERIVLTASPSS